MTLINKERLLEDLRERSSLDWDDEGEEYGMLLSRIIIDEQPTIEAIPVEWVENWIYKHMTYGIPDQMLKEWLAEQRKEE